MLNDLDLDDVRLVRAVFDTGALSAAADRLGVNGSTAFRRLGALEARLGLTLFERGRHGYRPTAAGDEVAAVALRLEDELAGLSRRLAGQAPAPEGVVRVTTNDALLTDLVTPLFAAFRRTQPGVRLDVVIANEALNLSRRDADVAIRATPNPPETLVGRHVATIAWALYGRVDGGLQSQDAFDPEAWADADWVGLGDALEGVAAARFVQRHVRAERVAYRVNAVGALVEAVEAGIGIGPLPCYAADSRPALVRLTQPDASLATPLWLLTHPDMRRTPRVRALLDFLAEAIARQRPALAGEH